MEEPESTSKQIQDEDRLAQLGYKQELKRDWSMLHNFGVSFSIIVSRPPFISTRWYQILRRTA